MRNSHYGGVGVSGSVDDENWAGGLSKSSNGSTLKKRGSVLMRVYLDNCCFNRPFDDQSRARVRLEAEAKLEIQQRITDKRIELAWSYVLEHENYANPFEVRRNLIARWKNEAVVDIEETDAIIQLAHEIGRRGIHAADALHVACAIGAGCDFFLTTDDMIVKSMQGFALITVMNPTQYIVEVE
jgi:predicted nucleic acid-binding protein